VEPEPTFLVEFTDGSDAVLSASELRVVGPAG
jgi:hypothetical protein